MPSPTRSGHIAALDGLRGCAILMVLCFHYSDWPPPTSSFGQVLLRIVQCGWIGVDLFFVLSGFLITGGLLANRSAHNFYRVFYLRRALRLFPVYYLAVILMFWVLVPLSHRPDLFGGFFAIYPLGAQPFSEQIWYWINISNLRTAFFPLLTPFLTIYWSLAIEEQFYLVWPACVRCFQPRNLLAISVASVIAIGALRNLSAVQAEDHLFYNFIYRMTPFHMDGLFCGAALGIVYFQPYRLKQMTRLAWVMFPCLLLTAIVLLWSPASDARWRTRVTLSVLALLFSSLLWICVNAGEATWITRFFELSLLRKFGRYSYFIYVFHGQVITYLAVARGTILRGFWLFHQGPLISYLTTVILALLLIYGLAALSSRFFEGPILRLKRHILYN